MPSPEPEPENYSIDDIMDRLRSREGGRDGDAQLVTREDGTQVYRMRKRKRRSHQPKKEKERRHRQFRVVQVVIAVGLVVLTGLAFLGSILYLNSSAYREGVIGRIRTWTGAEPKITELRVTPVSAGAATLELKWPETSVLDNLRVGGISGNLEATKLFGGKWKGNELYAATGGQLVLRPGSWTASPGTAPEGECPFEFRYRSSKFSVLMGNPEKPLFRIRDSEAVLTTLDPRAGTANLQFDGGYLETAGWGDFSLDIASLQFEAGKIRVGIVRMSPAVGSKGVLQIKNPTDVPLDPAGEGTTLDVHLARMPLNELLGSAFGNWFTATVESPDENSPGKLLLRASEKSGLSLRAPFRSVAGHEATASALPMFEVLAAQLKEPWYQRPRFDSVRGEVIKDGEIGGVDHLTLETRARLCLNGRVVARPDGRLEGTLDVGLPVAAVGDSTPQMRALFSKRSGELLWATFQISGSSRNPEDDMKKRLAAATPGTRTEAARGGDGDALEQSFRELTTPDAER